MPKLIATHEVDDVAHWLSSPKREEVFGPVASNISTFVDPNRPNHVGSQRGCRPWRRLEALGQSEAGAAAMAYDGVHPDTLVVYVGKIDLHACRGG